LFIIVTTTAPPRYQLPSSAIMPPLQGFPDMPYANSVGLADPHWV
jgi:hypothetical protein